MTSGSYRKRKTYDEVGRIRDHERRIDQNEIGYRVPGRRLGITPTGAPGSLGGGGSSGGIISLDPFTGNIIPAETINADIGSIEKLIKNVYTDKIIINGNNTSDDLPTGSGTSAEDTTNINDGTNTTFVNIPVTGTLTINKENTTTINFPQNQFFIYLPGVGDAIIKIELYNDDNLVTEFNIERSGDDIKYTKTFLGNTTYNRIKVLNQGETSVHLGGTGEQTILNTSPVIDIWDSASLYLSGNGYNGTFFIEDNKIKIKTNGEILELGTRSQLPPFTTEDERKVLQIDEGAPKWDLTDISDLKTFTPSIEGRAPILDFPARSILTSLGELQFETSFFTNLVAHDSNVVLTNPDGTNRTVTQGVFEVGLVHQGAGVPLVNMTFAGIRDGISFKEASIEIKSLENPAFKLVDTSTLSNTTGGEIDIGAIHFDAQATRTTGGQTTTYQTTFVSLHTSVEPKTYLYPAFRTTTTYNFGDRVYYDGKYYRLDGEISVGTYPDIHPSQWSEIENNSGTSDRGKWKLSIRDVDETFTGNDRFSDIIIADIDSGLFFNHSIYQPQTSIGSSVKNSTFLGGEIILGTPYSSTNLTGSEILMRNALTVPIVEFNTSLKPNPTNTTGAIAGIWRVGTVLKFKSNGKVANIGSATINPLNEQILPDSGNAYDIGSKLLRMRKGYFLNIDVSGDIILDGTVTLGSPYISTNTQGNQISLTNRTTVSRDIAFNPNTINPPTATTGPSTAMWTDGVNLIFKVNGEVKNIGGGGGGLNPLSESIIPDTSNAYDLGSSSRYMRDVYTGEIYVSGTTYLNGNTRIGSSASDTISINALLTKSFIPRNLSSDSINLGSPSYQFNYLYSKNAIISTSLIVNGTTYLGDAITDTINMTGRMNTDIIPYSHNQRSLGSSTRIFKYTYSGISYVNDSVRPTSSNSGSVGSSSRAFDIMYVNKFGKNLTPSSNGTYNLGASSARIRTIYVNYMDIQTNLQVNGNTQLGNSSSDQLGFFGMSPTSRQNLRLTANVSTDFYNLLAALKAYGLVTSN